MTSREFFIALASVAATLVVGGATIFYMHKSYAVQVQQLQIEKEKLQREKEKAEADRMAAALAADTYRQQLQQAQTKYANVLGALITEASEEVARNKDPANLLSATRALVSSRNSFRSSLDSISSRLNSEIDQLERELNQRSPNRARISELVETLQRKWPAKKVEIDIAVRKLLAELGLVADRFGR